MTKEPMKETKAALPELKRRKRKVPDDTQDLINEYYLYLQEHHKVLYMNLLTSKV